MVGAIKIKEPSGRAAALKSASPLRGGGYRRRESDLSCHQLAPGPAKQIDRPSIAEGRFCRRSAKAYNTIF